MEEQAIVQELWHEFWKNVLTECNATPVLNGEAETLEQKIRLVAHAYKELHLQNRNTQAPS